MKSKILVRIFGLFLVLLLVPVPVFPADEGEEMLRERDLARVRKRVEALRAWQLTEELNLDQETSSRLFPSMRDADRDRQRIEAENRALYSEMVRLIKGEKPDPGKINNILDQLQTNRMEMARIEDRHLNEVRRILSPEDSARYVVFQVRFQKELREKAARAFREDRGSQSGDFDRSQPGAGRSDGGSGGGMGRR